jgi:putative heme-binding domain-containing protein
MGLIRRQGAGKELPPFDAKSVASEKSLTDPTDAKQPLELRARSYLHANCAHCHMFGGGGAVDFQLIFSAALKDTKVIDERPKRGEFGLPDPRIIKPGDPYASTMLYRMAKFGRDRMPHLGAELPDPLGIRLIGDWIASMKPTTKPEAIEPGKAPDYYLSNPRSALYQSRRIALSECPPTERESMLQAASKLTPGPLRDLFEGYLVTHEKGPRKLGSNPRPRAILALKGDSANGEKLFWSTALNCGSCHKIGDKGLAVGPELTGIGKQRPRADLLESILDPSRRIEPKYASYNLQTLDGRSYTGLLVTRSEKEVVLRDAQNKEIKVNNVETLRPSRVSLMPEGQMAGLTAQEAADLLEYLATRR